MLAFEDGSEGLPLPVLDHHEEAVVVLEELVDLGDGEMVDFFEAVDLFLKQCAFVAADLVLVDDVDGAGEPGLEVDGLAQLVELVLLEAGRQQLVLLLDAALDLLDEVRLLELQLLSRPHHPAPRHRLHCLARTAAHPQLYYFETTYNFHFQG